MSAPRMLAVNGVELAVEDLGEGQRPFVLVHGLTGFRDDFRDHVPALSRLGRTILFDQRGHGQSSKTGNAASYTFAQLAGDLLGLLDALGISRCDLLGHSMGGMIALRFALAHPRRVASLVLMDTAARAPDEMPRAMLVAAGEFARSQGMEALAALLRARAAQETSRSEAERRLERRLGEVYWERRRWRLVAMDPECFAALVLELADQAPLTDRLGEIACPTLVLVGAEDAGFLAPAAEMAAGIRGAALVTIPGAAHSPQLENPAAWLAAIATHLESVRRPAA